MPLFSGFKSGVYSIVNTVNGKRYVGSATRSIKTRLQSHRFYLRKGTHCNRHLQAAWDRYGEAVFEFTVLHTCAGAMCIKFEQYWIDFYHTANNRYGYNLSPTAGNTFGMRMNEESKKRIAEAAKKRPPIDEEARTRISEEKKRCWADPGYRARLAETHRKRYEDPIEKAKLEEMAAKRWADPEQRKRQSELAKRTVYDEAKRANMSKAAYARWAKRKAKKSEK